MHLANQSPPVDHFRPKAALDELSEREEDYGVEHATLPQARGRRAGQSFRAGYWWLAYAWDNYVLSCERCNTGRKRSFFPIRGGHRGPPVRGAAEVALLLDPYGAIDPEEHLRFDDLGGVEARVGSELGRATIRTCGLDRPSLTSRRQETLSQVRARLERLREALDAMEDDAHVRQARYACDDLLGLGAEDRQFAAAVRTMVRDEIDLSWAELVDLRELLRRTPAR